MKIDDSDAIRHKIPLEIKRNVPQVDAITPARQKYSYPLIENSDLIYGDNESQSDNDNGGSFDNHKNIDNTNIDDQYIGNIYGLDDIEISPKITAIMDNMMAEITKLRGELYHSQQRILFLEDKGDHDPIAKCLTAVAFHRYLTKILLLDKDNHNNSSLAMVTVKNWDDIHHGMNRQSDGKVIHHIAETLGAVIDFGDVIGHIYDDQFAIILTAANKDQAKSFIEQINYKLKNNPLILSLKTIEINPQWVIIPLTEFTNANDVMVAADYEMRSLLNEK